MKFTRKFNLMILFIFLCSGLQVRCVEAFSPETIVRGSCLSEFISYLLRSGKNDSMTYARVIRIDSFYKTYITREWAQPDLSSYPTLNSIQDESQLLICDKRGQVLKQFTPLFQRNKSVRQIFLDPFMDIVAKLLRHPDFLNKPIFFNSRSIEGGNKTGFVLDADYLDTSQIVELWANYIDYLISLYPEIPIYFTNWPFANHRKKIIKERAMEISARMLERDFPQTVHVIPYIELPLKYNILSNPNHFYPQVYAFYADVINKSLYKDIKDQKKVVKYFDKLFDKTVVKESPFNLTESVDIFDAALKHKIQVNIPDKHYLKCTLREDFDDVFEKISNGKKISVWKLLKKGDLKIVKLMDGIDRCGKYAFSINYKGREILNQFGLTKVYDFKLDFCKEYELLEFIAKRLDSIFNGVDHGFAKNKKISNVKIEKVKEFNKIKSILYAEYLPCEPLLLPFRKYELIQEMLDLGKINLTRIKQDGKCIKFRLSFMAKKQIHSFDFYLGSKDHIEALKRDEVTLDKKNANKSKVKGRSTLKKATSDGKKPIDKNKDKKKSTKPVTDGKKPAKKNKR